MTEARAHTLGLAEKQPLQTHVNNLVDRVTGRLGNVTITYGIKRLGDNPAALNFQAPILVIPDGTFQDHLETSMISSINADDEWRYSYASYHVGPDYADGIITIDTSEEPTSLMPALPTVLHNPYDIVWAYVYQQLGVHQENSNLDYCIRARLKAIAEENRKRDQMENLRSDAIAISS